MSESNNNKDSIISKKTFVFALQIIKLYQFLSQEKREYVLSKQILKAGTSIGANVNEAVCAQSKRDFVHKLSISLKEARETMYWLALLQESSFLDKEIHKNLKSDCEEIIKILTSIILTTKERYFGKKDNS